MTATAPQSLAAFLEARLAEDEAVAQRARADYYSVDGGGLRYGEVGYETLPDLTIDPARVLAEVAAKRAVLSHCDLLIRGGESSSSIYDDGDADSGRTILRALAAVYADHPDYRSEWCP